MTFEALIAGVLIFVAGVATGLWLSRRLQQPEIRPEAPRFPSEPEPTPPSPPPNRPKAAPPPAAAGGREGATAVSTPPKKSTPPPASAGGSSSMEQYDVARKKKDEVPPKRGAGARPPLTKVASWGYQLQDLDIKGASKAPFDLLVIDYALDGSEETKLSPADISRLQKKPDGGRRIVLAYLSIGEAESYRFYWKPSWEKEKPVWLLSENPDWPENYPVCFWEADWQRLIFGAPDSYLDQIMAQGFDGVYLDKCDVFADLQCKRSPLIKQRGDLRADMVSFVAAVSRYAKAKDPDFQFVMQNAEELTEYPELVAAIDAIAREELLFGVDKPEKPNAEDDVQYWQAELQRVKDAGKPVFVVEYLNDAQKTAEALDRISNMGFVAYIAPKDRNLDRLNGPNLVA